MSRVVPLLGRQPTGFCDLCEVPFYGDADVRRHMGTVGHEAAVQAAREAEIKRKARLAFMYEDPDPEVTEHLEKVGQRMLAEGRWVVKPSERAGFS